MSSNLDNRTSSVRDIATLFPKGKRFGAKPSDLVNGAALNVCLDVHQAFEVLNTPAEQRVSILASDVFCADTPLGTVREGGDSRGAARLLVLSPGLSLDPKPKVVRPKTKTYFPKGSKMSLNSYPEEPGLRSSYPVTYPVEGYVTGNPVSHTPSSECAAGYVSLESRLRSRASGDLVKGAQGGPARGRPGSYSSLQEAS